ncbi:MAG: mandelate racemase/muconate lactonizing enzyme family protein, partial [Saccharolobus sp.]
NISQVEFPLAQIPSDLFNAEFKVYNGLVKVPDNISLNEELLREKYKLHKKLRLLRFSDLQGKI